MLKWNRETAQKKIDAGKRLTAGIMVAAGNHCIDTQVMDYFQKDKERKKELAIKRKKRQTAIRRSS